MNIAAYPKYDSYRDTGSDWIEDLPSHWEVQPVRANFAFRNEKNDPVITEEVLSLSIAHGVTLYSEEGRGGNKRKDDLTAYKIARPDDIVLNSMNVIVGAVGRSKYFGAISPVYYAMYATRPEVNVDYYDRVFSNSAFQKGLLRHGKGILMKLSGTGQLNTIRMKISQGDLKNVLLPAPPPEEQAAIVEFLDGKCATIDEAVRIKEEQIRLLAERRQILIQEAVTRGLNPDAPMKDSGIDWIGQIPAHWEAIPLKRLFRERNERTKTGEETLLSLRMVEGLVPHDDVSDKAISDADLVDYKKVFPGQMVMNRMRASIGLFGIVGQPGLVSPDYAIFDMRDDLYGPFFLNLFKIDQMGTRFRLSSRGLGTGSSGFMRLYTDDFGAISVPVPPSAEQKEIVDYIAGVEEKIGGAIALKQTQITALREYKTSLINAAVTGKIKVL